MSKHFPGIKIFETTANAQIHYDSTGQEIINDFQGSTRKHTFFLHLHHQLHSTTPPIFRRPSVHLADFQLNSQWSQVIRRILRNGLWKNSKKRGDFCWISRVIYSRRITPRRISGVCLFFFVSSSQKKRGDWIVGFCLGYIAEELVTYPKIETLTALTFPLKNAGWKMKFLWKGCFSGQIPLFSGWQKEKEISTRAWNEDWRKGFQIPGICSVPFRGLRILWLLRF